ncbi:hypothetical protein HRbin22_00189 [Candidatus Thermoflexus japonica]|uniref:Uncharacterized protein n=1 Tax=Candidatus Thermoflexus japonica TaxID=2035417 RepID=A0A2H5Y3E6_9CHLR|nr:hypothetical protein HRbin22_00189 [Candidatus Thermoflexus japonica]
MDRQWIEDRLRTLRAEIARLVKEGEDEDGLRLRSLLAELERWESIRRETMWASRPPDLSHNI